MPSTEREKGAYTNTNITGYGQSAKDDNGEGLSGVDLFAYGRAGVTFQGKPVYPIAVHQTAAGSMMYKVLEVVGDSGSGMKPFYGHVVDMCAIAHGCDNHLKNGYSFLVDVHKTGFEASGFKDGIIKGKYRVVGELRPQQLPSSVWISGVTSGKTPIMCSCSPELCKNMKWTPLGACK